MMTSSFFFYDLETSGVNPRTSRIMQFAGQRTDMDLKPIGEPVNVLIKLSDDILPEPDAILITGITPQKTLTDGITEAEFIKLFDEQVNTPGTIFVGFNSVRFDDEFMRFTFYRNFYESYEWQWKDGRSRWDMLDVARLTRALRPDGIEWPVDGEGKSTNRLELLASVNKLTHDNAHDALSDVHATIGVAALIKQKQPKLFNYLLEMRDKRKVSALANQGQPFVYASGKYPGEFEKTTIVCTLGPHPDRQGVLVYDLRHDPEEFLQLSAPELAERWRWQREPETPRLPVKALQFNRCPAVAPLGVLTDDNKIQLKTDIKQMMSHYKILRSNPDFIANLHGALQILNEERASQTTLLDDNRDVDGQLYDGFIDDVDRKQFASIRQSDSARLSDYVSKLNDERLKQLLPLYKARNFSATLNDEERVKWEEFRSTKLREQLPRFSKRLQALAEQSNISPEKQYLLEELHLYATSVLPEDLLV